MPINITQLKQNYPAFPSDVDLAAPSNSSLRPDDEHFLLYIPWQEKYLAFVPPEYQALFKEILPHLSARTTDVHTAVCFQYLDELINKTQVVVNRNVVAYALMLHDSGWSQMSEAEIAASLGVTGLALTKEALAPKEKHAVLGEQIARDVLTKRQSKLQLTDAEVDLICRAILYHDKPQEVAGAQNQMPIEVQLLVDLDHLWSFTHLNFWQDVLRKGVSPEEYLKNLKADLDSYFVTHVGKQKATQLLQERRREV